MHSEEDIFLIKLHQILNERFDSGELQTLCFYLGLDYDDLPGESKVNKVEKLILFYKRRQKIKYLSQKISEIRPDIDLEDSAVSNISKRLSILDIDGWHLLSGEKYNELWPKTFSIPKEGKRHNLQVGALVKLIFEFAVNEDPYSGEVLAERMWVKISGIAKPYYLGTLENEPVSSYLLDIGDEIVFLPEQIIDIWEE